MAVWELLKTVSLLKSEFTKENIKHKKLTTTKVNCKNDKIIMFWSTLLLGLVNSLVEKKINIKEKINPKINE